MRAATFFRESKIQKKNQISFFDQILYDYDRKLSVFFNQIVYDFMIGLESLAYLMISSILWRPIRYYFTSKYHTQSGVERLYKEEGFFPTGSLEFGGSKSI
jgi:hypothetical protein